jgi:uncharacterized repeat protein (TIGR03806 family)
VRRAPAPDRIKGNCLTRSSGFRRACASRFGRALAALGAWALATSASAPPAVDDALILGEGLPQRLSEFGLLAGPYGTVPNRRVTAYRLNTPLFSDYAEKWRYFYVPEGKAIGWRDEGVLDFPVGSVLVKSFGYPADFRKPDAAVRILETRLLIRRQGGWVALPYVWNEDGSDAILARAGKRIDIGWTDAGGQPRSLSYAVPNVNQCKGCHVDGAGMVVPIGPKAPNLDDGTQLQGFAKAGYLPGLPDRRARFPVWNDPASGTVEARARAYLDVNCGHCHNPSGPANTSGLWLHWQQPAGVNLGLGKRPTAAGRGSGSSEFAIAAGRPDDSILVYRMKSLDPGIAMPELGRGTIHDEGVALVSQWIAAMK